jgi:hypothetical protein
VQTNNMQQPAPWDSTPPLPAPWANESDAAPAPWEIEVREAAQRKYVAPKEAQELFSRLEAKHGLPQGLLDAVWAAESGRGKNMRSSAGAQGHFQFMPGTAKTYGLSDPNDLAQSADAAARYYSNLSKRFGGDVPKMLAGYNWGEGNVEKKGMGRLPAETRGYIEKITGMMGRGAKAVGEFIIPSASASEEFSGDPWAQFKEVPEESPEAAQEQEAQEAKEAQEVQASATTDAAPEDWTQFKEAPEETKAEPGSVKRVGEVLSSALPSGVVDAGVGALSGLASIAGNVEGLGESLYNGVTGGGWNLDPVRRNNEYIDNVSRDLGANTESSLPYEAGRLAGAVAGSAGVGPTLGAGAKMAPWLAERAPGFVTALETSGASAGPAATTMMGKAGNALTRMAGGAATGAVSAGIINPDQALTGAEIGAAIPAAGAAIGGIGKYVGGKMAGTVKPEVQALAQKAQALGIDIPADRIFDSKPMNALAVGLDYVPFSGRAAAMEAMDETGKRAVSRTFGQESSNIKVALAAAAKELGTKFEKALSETNVKLTPKFEKAMQDVAAEAEKTLVPAEAQLIRNQIDDIVSKAIPDESGNVEMVIEGQAAYNIKKTLDKLAKRSTNEAKSASDLRGALYDALNESMGPEQAAAFAKTRSQYGNMKEVEKLAQNGADGDVSWARVGNMKNAKSKELRDIADISAQFLKAKESAHGGSQRAAGAMLGWGAAGGSLLGLVGPTVVGRAINGALSSNELKRIAAGLPEQEANTLRQMAFKARKAASTAPAIFSSTQGQ